MIGAGNGDDTGAEAASHVPVLLAEVIEALAPAPGRVYVDGTFGGGGYSRALLDAADCKVIAIDRDPEAVARGRDLEARYADRFRMIAGRFGDMDALVPEGADGVALDIGVSSMQIDAPGRGFSFLADGPLDMRMEGADAQGPSAADVVNTASEGDLADIIYRYGEERLSRRIARALVAARAEAPITRTGRLADLVARAVGRGEPGRHPATRTFQALRIHVNDELGELVRGLGAAERLLRPAGRLAVVTFHSLEDRIVKKFLSSEAPDAPPASRHLPRAAEADAPPAFTVLFRGVRAPSAGEQAANPRARSAKLRAAERTTAPVRRLDARALGLPAIKGVAA